MVDNYVFAVIAVAVAAAVVGIWVRDIRQDRALTQPLSSVAGLYGVALVLYAGFYGYSLAHGFGGGGLPGSACVNTAFQSSGTSAAAYSARGGASVSLVGGIQACALHPSIAQWALFLLTRLPAILLWGWILLLVWQLIKNAARQGPFTAEAAATMHRLGWVVITGSMATGTLSAVGADILTQMLMTPATFHGGGIAAHVLISAPLKALLPVPALVGAALLSFARIIRAGVDMEEEIKATV